MLRTTALVLLLFFEASVGHSLLAQVPLYPIDPTQRYHLDRTNRLEVDTGRLTIELGLDHDEYLPGEASYVTISVENRTSSTVETFTPFLASTGYLFVTPDPAGPAVHYRNGDPPCCPNGRDDSLPTRFFASGEKVKFASRSSDEAFDMRDPRYHPAAFYMPTEPGQYFMRYSFGNGKTPFRVAAATVGAEAFVPLSRLQLFKDGNREAEAHRFVGLMVVKSGGVDYLVAGVGNRSTPYLLRDRQGNAIDNWSLAPYVRVAESRQPITAISGKEATTSSTAPLKPGDVGDESIDVTWSTAAARPVDHWEPTPSRRLGCVEKARP